MDTQVKRLPDNTVQITITVPWQDVEKEREKIIDQLVKEVTVPGFRKGTAPKNVASSQLPKERVNDELLKKVITDTYNSAISKEKITPIITPRIHIDAFEEGTALTFTAETCEEPTVELKNYKEEVKKITSKSKIAIPGKEEQKPNMEEVLNAALSQTDIKIPQILVEQEANRLLSQMIDELKTLGLTVDQYLASRNKKAEDLRKEYEDKAAADLKLEFMLRKIADEEKITVEQADVDQVLATLKDENQRKDVLKNPYFLASIIRQQKTLDFLAKL